MISSRSKNVITSNSSTMKLLGWSNLSLHSWFLMLPQLHGMFLSNTQNGKQKSCNVLVPKKTTLNLHFCLLSFCVICILFGQRALSRSTYSLSESILEKANTVNNPPGSCSFHLWRYFGFKVCAPPRSPLMIISLGWKEISLSVTSHVFHRNLCSMKVHSLLRPLPVVQSDTSFRG